MLLLVFLCSLNFINFSSGGLTPSDCAAKGCKWKQGTLKFYDYSETNPKLQQTLFSSYLSRAYVVRALLYINPLFLWQYDWMEVSSYHAYVVFRTVDVEWSSPGNWSSIYNAYWWSVEKNTETIWLQRSKDWTDVVFNLGGKDRYWEYMSKKHLHDWELGDLDKPLRARYFLDKVYKEYRSRLLVFNNHIEQPAAKVMEYVHDEMNEAYTLLHKNCKRFAKTVFNGLSETISWDYFKP